MELTPLRYALVLSEELSFQKAAARLNITQPNLSQQIKKLELELGTKLFERNNKTVKLTAQARDFITHIRSMLDELATAANSLKNESHTLSGDVIIGAIPTIGPYILPQLHSLLKKQAPGIRLVLREETTSTLIDSLKLGRCDLGLLALPLDDNTLATRLFGTDEFYLAVNSQHALTKKHHVTFKDIESERLLFMQEGHCFRDQALEFCHLNQDHPQIVFEGSSLTSVINLASRNYGLTFIPELCLPFHHTKQLKFIRFGKPRPSRKIGLAWRFTMPLTAAHKFVMESLEKAFSDIANNQSHHQTRS